jgi:hypothetical protein
MYEQKLYNDKLRLHFKQHKKVFLIKSKSNYLPYKTISYTKKKCICSTFECFYNILKNTQYNFIIF